MAIVRNWNDALIGTTRGALATRVLGFVAGSAFIALSAQLTILTPLSPVPITGQTFGVLMVGLLLGSRLGTASVLAYLVEAMAGLPVLSPAGAPGILRFLSPSGGYLIGFLPAVWLVGRIVADHSRHTVARGLTGLVAGSLTILLTGVVGLTVFVPFSQAIAIGLLPFLPGEALKVILAVPFLRLSGLVTSARLHR